VSCCFISFFEGLFLYHKTVACIYICFYLFLSAWYMVSHVLLKPVIFVEIAVLAAALKNMQQQLVCSAALFRVRSYK